MNLLVRSSHGLWGCNPVHLPQQVLEASRRGPELGVGAWYIIILLVSASNSPMAPSTIPAPKSLPFESKLTP